MQVEGGGSGLDGRFEGCVGDLHVVEPRVGDRRRQGSAEGVERRPLQGARNGGRDAVLSGAASPKQARREALCLRIDPVLQRRSAGRRREVGRRRCLGGEAPPAVAHRDVRREGESVLRARESGAKVKGLAWVHVQERSERREVAQDERVGPDRKGHVVQRVAGGGGQAGRAAALNRTAGGGEPQRVEGHPPLRHRPTRRQSQLRRVGGQAAAQAERVEPAAHREPVVEILRPDGKALNPGRRVAPPGVELGRECPRRDPKPVHPDRKRRARVLGRGGRGGQVTRPVPRRIGGLAQGGRGAVDRYRRQVESAPKQGPRAVLHRQRVDVRHRRGSGPVGGRSREGHVREPERLDPVAGRPLDGEGGLREGIGLTREELRRRGGAGLRLEPDQHEAHDPDDRADHPAHAPQQAAPPSAEARAGGRVGRRVGSSVW
ncbi:hypothetical protein SARU107417_10865 [Salinibacter ruber]